MKVTLYFRQFRAKGLIAIDDDLEYWMSKPLSFEQQMKIAELLKKKKNNMKLVQVNGDLYINDKKVKSVLYTDGTFDEFPLEDSAKNSSNESTIIGDGNVTVQNSENSVIKINK